MFLNHNQQYSGLTSLYCTWAGSFLVVLKGPYVISGIKFGSFTCKASTYLYSPCIYFSILY